MQQPSNHSRPTTAVQPQPSSHSRPATAVQPQPSNHSRPTTAVQPQPSSHSRPAVQPQPSSHSRPTTAVQPQPSNHSRPTTAVQPQSSNHSRLYLTGLLPSLLFYKKLGQHVEGIFLKLEVESTKVLSQWFTPHRSFPFKFSLRHAEMPLHLFPPTTEA